jgi:hypothetical protein
MDPEAPTGQPPENSVLLYPSYLKQLRGFFFVQAFPPESLGLRCPIRIPSCLMAFRRMEAVLGSFGAQRQKVPLGTLLEAQPHSSGWVPIVQLLLK